MRGLGGPCPPSPKSRQKLSNKNGMKLVKYTCRLRITSNSPHFSRIFSELALAGIATGRF